MSVILTSFTKSDMMLKKYPNIHPYSVSRFQPKGYVYDELSFLGAYDKNGSALHLYGRENPLETYANDWFDYLTSRELRVKRWLNNLDRHRDVMLCCWCPNISTRRQMGKYGKFACHTMLIGMVVNTHRPDIEVFVDDDRHYRSVDEWKPDNYKVIQI